MGFRVFGRPGAGRCAGCLTSEDQAEDSERLDMSAAQALRQMRAVGFRAYGGREQIQLLSVEKPIAKSGQLLVRTQYAGVNFIDTYQRCVSAADLLCFELIPPVCCSCAGTCAQARALQGPRTPPHPRCGGSRCHRGCGRGGYGIPGTKKRFSHVQ